MNLPFWLQWFAAIGDTLSGFVAAAALVLAVYAANRTLPDELKKFRRTRREQRNAEVAETVAQAAYRLWLTTESFHQFSEYDAVENKESKTDGDIFYEGTVRKLREIVSARNAYLEAWGLADIHDLPGVEEPLQELWNATGSILSAHQLHVTELNKPGTFPDSGERLFGDAAHNKINDAANALKRALRKFIEMQDTEEGATRTSEKTLARTP